MQRQRLRVFLIFSSFILCGILLRMRKSRQIEEIRQEFPQSVKLSSGVIRSVAPSPPTISNIEENNQSTVRWFDPDELLKATVEELKHAGFQVPNGKIAVQINRLGSELLSKDVKSISPPEDILATSERWKVAYVGCFYCRQNTPALLKITPASVKLSVKSCVESCVRLGKDYASIFAGRMCRCGTQVSERAISISVEPERCDMKCDKDNGEKCGGNSYASVYRIANRKNETLTMETVRRISAGCFLKSNDFNRTFILPSPNTRFNAAECLLHCERNGHIIAASDSYQTCHCGRFDSRFPFQQLGLPLNQCDSPCKGNPSDCHHNYVRIMRTNAEDDRCENRKFLSRSIGRLVALISFPGSGNTWVRYLIETATGIYTGSVYHDPDLYRNGGFIGEHLPWDSRRTCVIKTHQFEPSHVAKFEAAVFIVRNPYDAIMAEFNRVRGGHVGYAEPGLFRSMEWAYFVAYKISKWIKSIQNYSVMEKLLVVFFEDIVANPVHEVRRVIDFLGYPIDKLEQRLACLETNMSGNFKRPKRTLDFDAYSQKSKDTVNAFIREARRIFATRNLPFPPYER